MNKTFFKILFPEKLNPYILGGIAIVSFIFIFFSIERVDVKSVSMVPSIYPGDVFVVLKHVSPKRQDIVIFENSKKEGEMLLKRVIGMPTDLFWMRMGIVYINGLPLSEDAYINISAKGKESYPSKPIKIYDNFYFMLGDNREISRDSRSFDLVSRSMIEGRVICVIWPLKHRKIF